MQTFESLLSSHEWLILALHDRQLLADSRLPQQAEIGQKQWDGLPLTSASECQTEDANHSQR